MPAVLRLSAGSFAAGILIPVQDYIIPPAALQINDGYEKMEIAGIWIDKRIALKICFSRGKKTCVYLRRNDVCTYIFASGILFPASVRRRYRIRFIYDADGLMAVDCGTEFEKEVGPGELQQQNTAPRGSCGCPLKFFGKRADNVSIAEGAEDFPAAERNSNVCSKLLHN